MAARIAGWQRLLPGVQRLRDYRRAWLRNDVAAGLALAAVLVPVGVAYAVASGLPAICGLYATVTGLLAYALFGPSRILVLGPDSSLVALVVGVVVPLSAGDPGRAMALGGMMALVSGMFCLLAGAARLGFVTELLAKPIRYGYMNGIALTVVVSQLPGLIGVRAEADGVLPKAWHMLQQVAAGAVHLPTLVVGVATLAAILVFRRVRRLPAVLLAVAGAVLAMTLTDADVRHGIAVLGAMPSGLPGFVFPAIGWSDLPAVVLGGFAVALVSFADTSVLSRAWAGRSGTRVDANQEAVGLGAANILAGLFQGLPVSASSSRTPVVEAAGGRTQLAGVIGALAVAAMLVVGPGLLARLPMAALAAVAIASALALFVVADLRRIRRVQPWEFWLSIGCAAGVVVLGPIEGIGLAVGAAIVEFLWDGWRPHSAVLGRADGVAGYHDITRYPQARCLPGLVLFRWDAPLFFANAELFRTRILDAVAAAPQPVRRVVVGAEPITSVDVTAADILQELQEELRAGGIELCFAELKDPVMDKFRRFGLCGAGDAHRFFATLEEAVEAYERAHPVAWTSCIPDGSG